MHSTRSAPPRPQRKRDKAIPAHDPDICGLDVFGTISCPGCSADAEAAADRWALEMEAAAPEAELHLRRIEALIELVSTWPKSAKPGVNADYEIRRARLVRQFCVAVVEGGA